jgi:hypothetical protein
MHSSFADGHVEQKACADLPGCLAALSEALPQSRSGVSFGNTPMWAVRDNLPTPLRRRRFPESPDAAVDFCRQLAVHAD